MAKKLRLLLLDANVVLELFRRPFRKDATLEMSSPNVAKRSVFSTTGDMNKDYKCRRCGKEFRTSDPDPPCPSCGAREVEAMILPAKDDDCDDLFFLAGMGFFDDFF